MSGKPISSGARWRPAWALAVLALLAGGSPFGYAQTTPASAPPRQLPALLPDDPPPSGVTMIMTRKAMPKPGAVPPAATVPISTETATEASPSAEGADAGGAKGTAPDLGASTVIVDPNVQQAAGSCKCANVAAPGDTGPLPPVSPINAGDNYYSNGCGCGGSVCVPGQRCCHPDCDTNTWYGRLWAGFYECICCEDHCYEPAWHAVANSAFFTDGARPISQFTLAYEHGQHLPFPDRGEYFLARTGSQGVLRPPTAVASVPGQSFSVGSNLPFVPAANSGVAKGLKNAEQAVDYDKLMLITEAAAGKAGIVITTPFLGISPINNTRASGYGDTTIATKSLLLDCELLQLTFQFKTNILSGNFNRGLGTGHVSIEPDLLLALKLGPCTNLQFQLGEYIPLGGDTQYQSEVLKYSFSLNHVLWKPVPDIQIIGTLEGVGMTFQNGLYTDPNAVNVVVLPGAIGTSASGTPVPSPPVAYNLAPQRAATTYFSAGPGLRFVMCNKLDVGLGTQFHITDQRFADEVFRFEFRYRF